MSDMPIPLPAASFGELAVDLFFEARERAGIVHQLEVYAARWPSFTVNHTLAEAKAAADRTAQFYHFVKAMIPYEAEIRAMVAAMPVSPALSKEKAA
ncbi:hypothetical protein C3941_19670 [Kaistia algarum]|nr:hypothetical protein C3941_19670 [Kaistia algarum]